MITTLNKYLTLILAIALTICILTFQWFTYRSPLDPLAPKENPSVPPIVTTETSITVVPKTSTTDNDLELTQTYKAKVNDTYVEVPVVTLGPLATKENIKGVIKQSIDLTPVTQLQQELDKKIFKKNWEIGVGIGVHAGDKYVPVEIQRNFKVNQAVSIEAHLGTLKVTGGEIKYKRLF